MTFATITTPPPTAVATPRTAFIDEIRVVLTGLVILHHTAIAYGGSGGWYWREQPNASSTVLLLFNATNQTYFMGFFFLLAGYFTPPSYDRKGARRFLVDRFVRLGLPLLAYFFVLSPFTMALAHTSEGRPLLVEWWRMMAKRTFEPGPLWFAEALLIFSLAYVGWRRLFPCSPGASPGWPNAARLWFAAFATAALSFVIRLRVPVGENIAWLQLGYFPAYIVLFSFGCHASGTRLLEDVPWSRLKPWLWVSAVAWLTLPFVLALPHGGGHFEGGWSWLALFYALWDPLVAWGVIGAYLYWFQRRKLESSRTAARIARSAYAAYIVHPPVIVGLCLLAKSLSAPPLLKFVLVGAGACLASFSLGAVALRIPGARRVL
jgi:fucose 4-O-acetylase-like acetyltransferase